jgi:hypothetical protein
MCGLTPLQLACEVSSDSMILKILNLFPAAASIVYDTYIPGETPLLGPPLLLACNRARDTVVLILEPLWGQTSLRRCLWPFPGEHPLQGPAREQGHLYTMHIEWGTMLPRSY